MQRTRFYLVLLVALVAFAGSRALAETSETVRPWQRGTYSKDVSGADTLTVDGNVKITGQSSSPALIGEVVMTDKSVIWKGRVAGQGVFYTVWGYYEGEGGGGGGSNQWFAWYDCEGGPRLTLVPYVGNLASVDVWPKNGNENRLLVTLLGSEADKTYSIRLFVDDVQKLTLTPLTFDLARGNPTRWVTASALAAGEVQIKGYCENQEGVTEGIANVTIGEYKPRDPNDPETLKKWTPQGTMWNMGGDWEPVPNEFDRCFYEGRQALRAVDIKDLDFDESTGEEIEDTFSKSDAIMWRCDKVGEMESGSFSPPFGVATVWYGVAADTGIESSGIILDVKDDAKYAKDDKPTKQQMYAAYPPSQGKDPCPHADSYRPGYFLADSLRVRYYEPGRVKSIVLKDDNGGGGSDRVATCWKLLAVQ